MIIQYEAFPVAGQRGKHFKPEYLEAFEADHKEAFPEKDIKKALGFPDTGNGRYSDKLTYAEWFNFNNW